MKTFEVESCVRGHHVFKGICARGCLEFNLVRI